MSGPRVRHAAAAHETFVVRIWRWVKITIWHVFYGQNEWQRLCSPGADVDEEERVVRFRTELALSSKMVQTCNVVFDNEPFPVEATLHDVATRAKLDEKDATLMNNVRSCLLRCNFVNKVYARVHALKNEGYSSANPEHEEMLEQLWTNLKPGVRREGGRITKDEIGTDPMSDFRGMGLFSLIQLNYFTKGYKVEAQRALEESNHPTRWYPFAVTGINVTAFMIELIDGRLLDIELYRFGRRLNGNDVDSGLQQLHDVYATIFTRFNKLWVDTNPRDVMAFPTIFQSLKDDIRRELTQKAARAHAKKKQYKRGHATKNRARDIDQIQDDLRVEKVTGKNMAFEEDEDLPGLGQFYCTPCGRHFIDAKTRDVHLKTKVHKRRLKDVAQKQYTQNEAMQGAGKGVETYKAAHPKETDDMDDL
ncbi:hypothetical protein PHMEG_0007977 [Phytophthora megakarya]|uniref:C2H2-type domain-containing protein n=1 Tax=Phytophthora megakarya TaxID=4795 RepID=A0A225WK53_9STRA|nr:hypothetical protein PHMEG_0007977 [Phytophthora megakarya]